MTDILDYENPPKTSPCANNCPYPVFQKEDGTLTHVDPDSEYSDMGTQCNLFATIKKETP